MSKQQNTRISAENIMRGLTFKVRAAATTSRDTIVRNCLLNTDPGSEAHNQQTYLFPFLSQMVRVIVVTKCEDVPTKPVDDKPMLVYWNLLGLVQFNRFALIQANVDFCDVRIDADEPSCANFRKCWMDAKAGALQDVLDFPNLPYFLDGHGENKIALTQSNAILRHIGRRYNLMGNPCKEHLVDMIVDELSDVESNITRRAYAHGKDAIASWYETDIPDVMKRFLPMIDNSFLTGDQVSIADCKFYSFLYKLQLIEDEMGGPKTADIMNDTVRAYMQRFEALPRIKAYMASPDYQKGPLNNRHAKWGG